MPETQSKPIIKNLILCLISIIFSFLLLEVGVRIALPETNSIYKPDSLLGWKLRPNASVFDYKDYASEERLNDNAWRGPNRSYEPNPNALRIATLGDSVTYGVSINDDENTYARILEKQLIENYNLQNAEVFNFGTPGYGSYHGISLMDREIKNLKPQIITIYYGWNDRTRVAAWHSNRETAEFVRSPWHHSKLIRNFVWFTRPQMTDLRRSRKLRDLFGENFLKLGATSEEVDSNIRGIVQKAKDMGATPVLITSPWGKRNKNELIQKFQSASPEEREDLTPSLPYSAHSIEVYNQMVRNIAKETGAVLIDLASSFEAFAKEDINNYFNGFIHPNEKGHAFVASQLAPVIQAIAVSRYSSD